MIAALTFDDGPSQWTAPILDLLEFAPDARATFFVCGHAIAGNEATLKRMVDIGCEVGVHGWTHRHMPTLTNHEAEDELYRCRDAITEATGVRPNLWRAPYLDTDMRINMIAQDLGLTHAGAEVIVGDWAIRTPERIARNVLVGVFDFATVLLHDGIPPDGGTGTDTRQPTVDAVALLLAEDGIEWRTYSEA